MMAAATRLAHRRVAAAFLLAVAAYIIAMAFGRVPVWLTYLPLAPLFGLMASGTVMLLRSST